MSKEDNLTKIGENFGSDIATLLLRNRAFTVTIDSVDEDFAYVIIGGSTVPQPVPLTGISIKTAAFKIKPNVGSLAVIQFSDSREAAPFFIAFSEIDYFSFTRGTTAFSWEMTPTGRSEDEEQMELEGETDDVINLAIGESTLKVDKALWEFNGGTLGGLIKLAEITEKLNALEDAYNSLVSNYNAHVHITTATVAATPTPGVIAPTTSLETTVLVATQTSEIENEKITQ